VHDTITLGQSAEYAAEKGVPLFFVGIGDEDEIRDLKLHDLQSTTRCTSTTASSSKPA